MNIGAWTAVAKKRLASFTETPLLDVQVLLAHTLARPRTWIAAHPEETLTPEDLTHLEEFLKKLENNIPLPYVLGTREFYGRQFFVTPDVLIPRPETEHLIEAALDWLKASGRVGLAVVDVGTGSGCIAVTLATEAPSLRVTATDISPVALKVARKNAHSHSVSIEFIQTNLLNNLLSSTFDLIISNPPYIPTRTLHDLDVYEREPTLALDGGREGLEIIEKILQQAGAKLLPGGLCLIEIDSSQGQSAPITAHRYFPKARIDVISDLAGHPRVLRVQT